MTGLRGAYQVSRRGGAVSEGARGLSDAATGELCTVATRFQAASISKHIVAASVLLLNERGTLSLADAVRRWWSPAPPAWESMTVHQLLTHSSGLMHWPQMPGVEISDPPDAQEILEQATKLPLRFRPGTSWEYSGVGYLVAAAIIEEASGQTYRAFTTDHIFDPLEMTSTTSGLTPSGGGVARGYRDGQPVPSVPGLTALQGTGDLWTTVTDLVRYGTAVSSGALLSKRSWQLMSQPHTIIDEGGSGTGSVVTSASGYGMFLGTIAGQRIQYQPGDNPGFRSLLAWLPEADTTIALLCNDESTVLDDLALGLLPPNTE